MAFEIPGQMITLPASTLVASSSGGDSDRYRFVSVSTAGQATHPSSGAAAIGVLQNQPKTENDMATVMVSGVSKVKLNAASTVGVPDLVAVSTDGEVIALAAGDAAVGRIVAGTSGGAGRIVSVLIGSVGGSTEPLRT
jgi:hypothetical protein